MRYISRRRALSCVQRKIQRWGSVGALVLLCTLFDPFALTVHANAAPGSTYLVDDGRSSFNGNETSITPTTAPNLRLRWNRTTSAPISAQPVAANGLLYWGSWDGDEYATDLNGHLIWATYLGKKTDANCSPSSAGVASTATIASVMLKGTLTSVDFVSGGDGSFYALNAFSGEVIWHTLLASSPGAFLWSSPAVYNGSVYIGVASFGDCPLSQGQLIQLSATTGGIEHTFDVVPSGCTGGGVWGSPAIDDTTNTIYFATGNEGSCLLNEQYTDSVIALSTADLGLIDDWQLSPSEQVYDGDFGTTPTLFSAVIGGSVRPLLGIANKNGRYYALDRTKLSDGPLWVTQIAVGGDCSQCGQGSIASSAWDGTTLYVAGGNTTINGAACQGSIWALDPTLGAPLWVTCLKDGPVLGAVTAVPGIVVVGEGASLLVMAAASGQTLFSYQDAAQDSRFLGAALIYNGGLYVGNADGNLYAFGQ